MNSGKVQMQLGYTNTPELEEVSRFLDSLSDVEKERFMGFIQGAKFVKKTTQSTSHITQKGVTSNGNSKDRS